MSKNTDQNDQKTVSVDTPKSQTKKHVIKLKNIKARPVLLYSSAFVMLLSLVSIGYYQPSSSDFSLANASAASDNGQSAQSANSVSVDEKLATDIAATFAVQTKMPVAANVANLSVSLQAQKEMAQTDDSTVAKPQIVQPTSDSRSVTVYKAKQGDTISSIAAAHSLQPETIRWANNVASDNIEPGRDVTIPPVDGVLYTVKEGDTVQALASKYSSSSERIVAFNDLEVNGIAKDVQIVIPGGTMPETERPGYQAPVTSRPSVTPFGQVSSYTGGVDFSRASQSVGNAYAPGNCTWYAFERRAQLGRPIGSFWGNASTWAMNAIAAGFPVNKVPQAGAIAQWNAYSSNRGVSPYYGHVGVVERVNPDGTVTISEMNVAGFNQVSSVTLSAGQVDNYIH